MIFPAMLQRQSSDLRAVEEDKIKFNHRRHEGLNVSPCKGTLSRDLAVFNFSSTDINELFVADFPVQGLQLINDLPSLWL